MPSTFKSPYASSFKSAIKRGTPFHVVVDNIAKRTGKPFSVIANSLHKADLCFRQKFNGQYVYWPCEPGRCAATVRKNLQIEMWQCFVDWCIASGHCKPEQLWNNTGGQNQFMVWCKKFWGRQTTTSTSKTTGRKRTTASKKRTAPTKARRTSRSRSVKRPGTGSRTYKFPAARRRKTTGRKVRRAA